MRKLLALLVFVLVSSLVLSGCLTGGFGGGCSAGGGGAQDMVCTTNAECPSGSSCVYDVGFACQATGMCEVDQQQASFPAKCGAAESVVACGCDGTTVTWESGCAGGLSEGYSPQPIAHMGACVTQ
jgi:hypothetical protein